MAPHALRANTNICFFPLAAALEPGHHPSSSADKQQCSADIHLLLCHPVGETVEAERGPRDSCGCRLVNLPLISFPSLHQFMHPPYHSSSPLPPPTPPLFGSTFPFRVSSSSCHKEPPFSPEGRLPVPHCNPIIYLTEECVISTE